MNNKVVISLLLISSSLAVCADETCDQAMAEGKQKLNAGRRNEAKALFQYVQGECGATYGDANVWVKKCDEVPAPPKSTLSLSMSNWSVSANGESVTVSVGSNTSWYVVETPSWVTVGNKSNSFVIFQCQPNSNNTSRSGSIRLQTSDGRCTRRIEVSQSAKEINNPSPSPSPSPSSTATLSVNKSTLSISPYGGTEYITVICNTSWEIQFPSSSMYTTSRSGNTITIIVKSNPNSKTRTDFFVVRTKDKSKSIRINLSQAGKSTYSSSTSETTYGKYTQRHGTFEATWGGFRMGICTGYEYTISLMRMRIGPIQMKPIEFDMSYDFISDDLLLRYQPALDFVIPCASNHAVYFGAGPSYDFLSDNVWFNVETGWHYHWGTSVSSDFFMRYDGIFSIGASLQWSTGF